MVATCDCCNTALDAGLVAARMVKIKIVVDDWDKQRKSAPEQVEADCMVFVAALQRLRGGVATGWGQMQIRHRESFAFV